MERAWVDVPPCGMLERRCQLEQLSERAGVGYLVLLWKEGVDRECECAQVREVHVVEKRA